MSKKLIGLGVVALLAVAVIGVTFPKVDVSSVSQGPQGIQGPQGPAGPQGERGSAGSAGQSVQGLDRLLTALQGLLATLSNQPKEPKLGAFPGLDITSDYLSRGGNATYEKQVAITKASSTLAVIKLPRATTSPDFVSFNVTQGTSSTYYLVVEATSTPYAEPLGAATNTTRTLFSTLIPANFVGSVIFRSTSTQSFSDLATGVTETIQSVLPGSLLGLPPNATSASSTYLVFHAKQTNNYGVSTNATNLIATGTVRVLLREL